MTIFLVCIVLSLLVKIIFSVTSEYVVVAENGVALDIIFDCVWLVMAHILIIFAIMIAKLVIKFSKPYSIEDHQNHLLAFCENHR